MPDIDGGHHFLTLLAPVRLGDIDGPDGAVTTHARLLRRELATLPTARQSAVSVETDLDSPFARCTRTHFLRLVLLDQPMWNGRDPVNPLAAAVRRIDPLVHQKFDVLSRPWLLLAADIDVTDEPDRGLTSWAEGLWRLSGPEMRAIFAHCHGFEAVDSPGAFAERLLRCRVPTTMSFNDYWPGRPPLKGETFGRLAFGILALAAGVTALLWALLQPASLWWLPPLLVLGLAAGVAVAAWRLWTLGGKAFPPAPDSDLPSVLKALHVQQRFALFAADVQAKTPAERHAAFGRFLGRVRPADVSAPTQKPGVIRSDAVPLETPELVDDKQVVL
jgi:hypothetical protein